jgi:hypothetical protein
VLYNFGIDDSGALDRSSFEKRLAVGKTAQIFDRDTRDFAQGFLSKKSLMRSDENVWEAK